MVARKLAKRIVAGRISYSQAEIGLMQQRAGRHYQRLERAEHEAARALSRAFRRMEKADKAAHQIKLARATETSEP